MSIIKLILLISGLWNIIDGIGSILRYINQPFLDHSVRIIRAIIGVLLLFILLKIHQND